MLRTSVTVLLLGEAVNGNVPAAVATAPPLADIISAERLAQMQHVVASWPWGYYKVHLNMCIYVNLNRFKFLKKKKFFKGCDFKKKIKTSEHYYNRIHIKLFFFADCTITGKSLKKNWTKKFPFHSQSHVKQFVFYLGNSWTSWICLVWKSVAVPDILSFLRVSGQTQQYSMNGLRFFFVSGEWNNPRVDFKRRLHNMCLNPPCGSLQ